ATDGEGATGRVVGRTLTAGCVVCRCVTTTAVVAPPATTADAVMASTTTLVDQTPIDAPATDAADVVDEMLAEAPNSIPAARASTRRLTRSFARGVGPSASLTESSKACVFGLRSLMAPSRRLERGGVPALARIVL